VASEPEGAAVRVGDLRGRVVVLSTVLGSGVAVLDGTIVNVALPRPKRRPSRHVAVVAVRLTRLASSTWSTSRSMPHSPEPCAPGCSSNRSSRDRLGCGPARRSAVKAGHAPVHERLRRSGRQDRYPPADDRRMAQHTATGFVLLSSHQATRTTCRRFFPRSPSWGSGLP
jgi:hypothetical protein